MGDVLKILISSLREGGNEVTLEGTAEELPGIFDEFFGKISFEGKVKKIREKYVVTGTAIGYAELTCDKSGKSYRENIQADIDASFIQNHTMALEAEESPNEKNLSEYYLFDDDRYLDLSREIAEALSVSIPLKKIAPEFRDKDITEVFPELDNLKPEKEDESDKNTPFSDLNKINFN